MLQLKKATRKAVKIRMSIAAPTGFGKTMGSLLVAYGMTNDWEKIAVIDTENESASLYSDHTINKTGFHIGEFYTVPLAPPFTPEKYSEAIKACEDAGIEVIIIDSVTHVWSGQGGLLESNNQLGGTFQSWAKTTPRYQKWLDNILQSKCHIITTNRKKQGYNVVTENNKTKVEKVGMEDQIRDGYDYEMTIALEVMNNQHLCFASKDRTGMFADVPEFVISEDTGKMIKKWCESGFDEKSAAIAEISNVSSIDEMGVVWSKYKKYQTDPDFVSAKDARKGELVKETMEPVADTTKAKVTKGKKEVENV